jgi:hypothetical protein
MSSAAHAPIAPHAFAPSGRVVIDARGRRLSICATCGKLRVGATHRADGAALPVEWRRGAEPKPAPEPKPKPEPKPRRRPELVPAAPRELIELALMLDAVIELPPELIGWRVHLRSQSLRSAIPEIPPSRPARAPAELDETGDSLPAASPSRARSDAAGVNPAAPAAATQEPAVLIEHAPRSERSRARALAKAIKDARFRELAVRAIVAGWTLERTGSGHWKIKHGASALVIPQTPSDHRSWMNARAHARRLGIDTEGL